MKITRTLALILIFISLTYLFFYFFPKKREVIYFHNWSDYIDKEVLNDFYKETGIKVKYSVFDSNEMLQTSLFTGDDKYDVVVPSAYFLNKQIKFGIYQKLDKKKIPNLKYLSKEITDKIKEADPGNEYSVNYFLGLTGIGVVRKEVEKYLPDPPLNSLRMIFDKEVISKIAKCGVYIIDESSEIIPTVMLYLGLDPKSKKKEDFEAAEKLLMEIIPYVKKITSVDYTKALVNGEACVVFAWSGGIYQAQEAAQKTGKNVEFFIPQEGTQMWFDQMAIPKNAPSPENAHKFINYILRPDISARLIKKIRYPSANKAGVELAKKNDKENLLKFFNLKEIKTYTLVNYDNKIQKILTDIWLRVKTSR